MRRGRRNRSRCHNTLIHRRAKALALVLGKMGVFIRDYKRIVGYQTADPNGLFHPIDQNCRPVKRLVNSEAGRTLLEDRDRKEFDDLCSYWEGKSMSDRHQAVFTGDLSKYWKYEGTFSKGLQDHIIARTEQRLA